MEQGGARALCAGNRPARRHQWRHDLALALQGREPPLVLSARLPTSLRRPHLSSTLYQPCWEGHPSTTTTSSSRRREDVHSGVAVPMPPRRPAPAAQMRAEHECKRCGACGPTSHPSTCTAPTWSDAVESQYRNHALPALGRAGHGHRSLPAGPARLLDRRQRLPRTVPAIHPTGGDLGPQVAARPYPVPCQLTQSDRDLLLDRATQGPDAKRLRRYRGTRPPPPLREPLRQDRQTVRMDVYPRRLDQTPQENSL